MNELYRPFESKTLADGRLFGHAGCTGTGRRRAGVQACPAGGPTSAAACLLDAVTPAVFGSKCSTPSSSEQNRRTPVWLKTRVPNPLRNSPSTRTTTGTVA
jgi:hypothetical protein